MKKIAILAGTRPEAIKLAPLVLAFEAEKNRVELQLIHSGQHAELTDAVFSLYGLSPDHRLPSLTGDRSLAQLHAHLLRALSDLLQQLQPDLLIVQGDTTTALAGAQAAFYQHIRVAHVEAGLHTSRPDLPFPEEANRRQISHLAHWHFAPTDGAAAYLRHQGVDKDRILTSGNTGIDALHWIREQNKRRPPDLSVYLPGLQEHSIFALVTFHRRENQQTNLPVFARQLRQLAQSGRLQLVFPLHPNPVLRQYLETELSATPGIQLTPALPHHVFVALMERSCLLISDSGGIQEEATALGKPLLLLRPETERPEAVESGNCIPVAPEALFTEALRLLEDQTYYREKSRKDNPFGDGRASRRIVQWLLDGRV